MIRWIQYLACSGLVFAVANAAATAGPSSNPDDQFRFFWYLDPCRYAEARDAGFNMLINTIHDSHWWTSGPEERANRVARRKDAFELFDRMSADGVDYIEKLTLCASLGMRKKYPQTNADGSPNYGSIDTVRPDFQEEMHRLVAEAADHLKGHSAVIGVHVSSEVRDHSVPSFSSAYAESCRKELGYDMPKDIVKPRMSLLSLADFPVDGVVETGYRPLEYLVWYWRKGDGWNNFNNEVKDIFRERLGRDVCTVFDPITRTPPIWGSGGQVTYGDQWFYAQPQPYGVSFVISEELAMARGTPGQGTMIMLQGIMNRRRAAPPQVKVDNLPAWCAYTGKDCSYITQPPDMLREAIWMAFSRKIDGIGLYAWNALWGYGSSGRGYACTESTAISAVKDAFLRVGVPLGPLLKAVPERAPEVAMIESYASSILASVGSMGWNYNWGDLMVAANMTPYVLYEEEIARSGIPKSVKVILAPDTPAITRGTYEALRKFQEKGGVIAADAQLAPAILADVSLPNYLMNRFDRAQRPADDTEVMRRAARDLRASLAHVLTPYGDASRGDILVHVRSYRNADYVFAVNDRRDFGDYIGQWGRIAEKGLPNEGVISVRRSAGAVYDIERHVKVDFSVKGGVTTIPVSYSTTDGRIFLVSPRELGSISCSISDETLTIRSPDTDVMIPIEVVVDGGKPRYGVIENGVWARPYKGGTNVCVRNLADGSVAHQGEKIDPVAQAAVVVTPLSTVEAPEAFVHRGNVRQALGVSNEESRRESIKKALQDRDPMVRRYALVVLQQEKDSAALKAAKLLIDDPDASVRMVAKSINRIGGLYRHNVAWSMSEQNDHDTERLESVRITNGTFEFQKNDGDQEGIELWLGKPTQDLHVWLNGTYLGQFDSDSQAGTEFRLDASKESCVGVNTLVVKDAKGRDVPVSGTAERLRWSGH